MEVSSDLAGSVASQSQVDRGRDGSVVVAPHPLAVHFVPGIPRPASLRSADLRIRLISILRAFVYRRRPSSIGRDLQQLVATCLPPAAAVNFSRPDLLPDTVSFSPPSCRLVAVFFLQNEREHSRI